MNYYQRFLGDYARDTRHLSLAAHGAYGLLLDAYYATEKPLPADLDSLCRICGAINSQERVAVSSVAELFFPLSADGLRHNKRADIEITKAIPRIAAAKANGLKRGKQDGSQQEATSLPSGATALHLHQSSTPPPTPSPTPSPQGQNPSPEPRKTRHRSSGNGQAEAVTAETWNAYSAAYLRRYGVNPVRNRKVNGQLAAFVERIGADESPGVAAFYVEHNRGLYVSSKHATELLLRDCEGLHTEWVTGKSVTDTEARQTDRTAATGAVFNKMIQEAEKS